MIFSSLTLENIGPFHGRHELNLLPPSDDKPIVLLGALNGAGKTTILNALQLGLYGKRAKSLVRVKSGYEDYLRKLVNRKARPSEGAQVELSFQLDDSGGTAQYRVVRSWLFKSRRPVETLDVYVDDVYDAVLSENWDEEVERFVPWNLAHLFFFDGERIEALADPAQSAEILRTGIYTLLGIELVDQLQADLNVYRNRKRKSVAAPDNQQKITEIESQLAVLSSNRKTLVEELARTNNDLAAAENRLRAAIATFDKQGGQLFEERRQLETARIELTTNLQRIDENLREIAAGALPLQLVAPNLRKLAKTAERERSAEKAKSLLDSLFERDEKLINWLSARNYADGTVVNDLMAYLSKERAAVKKKAAKQPTIRLSDNAVAQLRNLLDTVLQSESKKSAKLSKDREQLLQEIDNIERSLLKVPEESLIHVYIEKKAKASAECDQIVRDRQIIEDRLKQLKLKRELATRELDRQLESVKDYEIESEENQRLTEYSKKIQGVLGRLRKRTLVAHIGTLEQHITEAFKALMRKTSLIETVTIDPDDFTVSVYSQGGAKLSPALLSAGERQILAIAILWGLGRAAGRQLPIVMDTPLGRLDSAHRKNLVEKYFPEASHQVILLSTDEEIDEKFSIDLDNSIAHRYLLDYDDAAESTSVKQGYFW